MRVRDPHLQYQQSTAELTRMQVHNAIAPLDIIDVLNTNHVRFVLVGTHGLAGWIKNPRASVDVELVIAERHLKKATRALRDAFSLLEAEELEAVVRLKESASGRFRIDLLRPQAIYQHASKHTHFIMVGNEGYLVPSLEMALAMKFAAIVYPDRSMLNTYQNAHDFLLMAKGHPETYDTVLKALGDLVHPDGGTALLEMVRKAREGEAILL